MQEVERYLARASSVKPLTSKVDGGAFTASPYVMAPHFGGLVTPTHFTYAVDMLTRGATTPSYELGVEEAFMVIDGVLDLETFAGDGTSTVQRLGARDLALVPAGMQHRLTNSDAATARFGSIVGTKDGVPIAWERALSAASA
jgi:glyoxylate utilization-related uncharacterized protein